MEMRNAQTFSISSVQYLPYRISFEEKIFTPGKNVYVLKYLSPLGYKENIDTRGKTTRKKQHERQQQ